MSGTIVSETSKQGIASIRLNRPERANALTAAMIDELVHHIRALTLDENVRIMVLRAEGRHFCAGADVNPDQRATAPTFGLADLFEAVDQFPKPTICLVQGAAVGAGACLAACFDVVCGYPDAYFSIPEVRLGIAPKGVIAVLIRAMGPRNLRRYALSGEQIRGAQMIQTGLVHEIHEASHMDAAVAELVEAMLLGGPNAQAATKRQIADYDHATVRDMKKAAREHQGPHGIQTAEGREGVTAFREKRKPSWYVAP